MRSTIKQLRQYANQFRHHLLAFLLPSLVFVATQLAPTWSAPVTFSLYVAAVFVGAYVGGRRAGIAAIALAVGFVIWRYGFATRGSQMLDLTELYPVLVPFAIVGVLASHLANSSQRSVSLFSNIHETILNMTEAVILTDQRGQVAFMNKAAETLTGWGADGVKKSVENVLRLLDEGTRQPIAAPATQMLKGESPAVREALGLLVSKDNMERLVEYTAEPLKDAHGAVTGLVLLFRDVSQRRGADQELRQREAQFRALAAAAPVGILTLDQTGACTYCNAACQALAGLSPKEGQGTGWTKFVQPEDARIAEEWKTAAQQGLPFNKECRFQDAQNQIHWVRVRAEAARSDRGQYLGHVAVLEDIGSQKDLERTLAEQKQATENLRATFQDREAQANKRIAALDTARTQLEAQLTDHQQTADSVRRDSGQKQTEWQQLETKLRQDMAGVAESHRRELERVIAERKQLEDALQQARQQKTGTGDPRVTSLDSLQKQLQDQLAERQKELETLKDEYALFQTEWEEAEAKLRQELASLTQTSERHRKQLSESQERERNLRRELEQARSEHDRAVEQHRREEESWSRRHAELQEQRDGKHSQLEEQRSHWEQRHQSLSSDLERLRREHEAARNKHGELEEERSQWQQRHHSLAADLDKLNERHEAIRSAHQSLEERCRLLDGVLRHVAEGVCAIDKDGTIVFFNAAAEAMLGWPEAEVRGQSIERLAADNDSPLVPTLLFGSDELAEGRSQTGVCERDGLLLRKQDGEPLAVSGTVANFGAGDQVEGAVMAFRLPRKSAESSVATSNNGPDARATNRSIDKVLRRLAECSAPILSEIQHAFAAVRANFESGVSHEAPAAVMERQMQRLTRHLQRLATAGQIADGSLPLSKQAVDIADVVQSTLAAVRPIVEERGHHLTMALPLGPEPVWADQAAIAQALSILLENAATYTPVGGQVSLTVERHADEVWLRVKDNGRGLPTQSLPELMNLSAVTQHFWYGDSDGLGIGVALARSLAEVHGGTLTAISGGPGLGSEFVLRWPAWQEDMRIDEGSPEFPGNRTHLWRSPALLSLTAGRTEQAA